MTDQELLKELLDQREWWEKEVDREQKKLEGFKAELAKTNRLIELLELKIKWISYDRQRKIRSDKSRD